MLASKKFTLDLIETLGLSVIDYKDNDYHCHIVIEVYSRIGYIFLLYLSDRFYFSIPLMGRGVF